MRISLTVILAALFSLPVHASLKAFYTFDGNANDVTANGYNGTVSNATINANGYQGQAYEFNGLNSSIAIYNLDISPLAMPDLTMGAWVKANSISGIRAILSHDNGGYDRNLNIDVRACPTGCVGAFTGTGVLSGAQMSTDIWTFTAVRYSASTGEIILTVNGTNYSGTGYPGSGFSNLFIGTNPGFGEVFDGLIDNVFVYDQFLTEDQMNDVRAQGAPAIQAIGDVPEPSTYVLLGSAFCGLALIRRLGIVKLR